MSSQRRHVSRGGAAARPNNANERTSESKNHDCMNKRRRPVDVFFFVLRSFHIITFLFSFVLSFFLSFPALFNFLNSCFYPRHFRFLVRNLRFGFLLLMHGDISALQQACICTTASFSNQRRGLKKEKKKHGLIEFLDCGLKR